MPSHSSDQIFWGDDTIQHLRHRLGHVGPAVAGLLVLLAIWHHRHRSRTALARLEGHELQDIGLSHHQARQEAAKPFWRG